MAKKSKFRFYDIRETLKAYPNAHYYVIYGERSNGKTYSSLDYALERFVKHGEQFAYVRRMGEDVRRKHMTVLFAGHESNGRISELTKGIFNGVEFIGGKFYLTGYDEDEKPIKMEEPCGFTFDLNSMEHYKSTSFPNVTTIIFDEFLSRVGYLPNEFILFQNTISTIVRLRTNVKIIMLGNTVNKYCPYFTEMGLTHVREQKNGTIDVYHYGSSQLEVVVEYCESSEKRGGKDSNVYFAFDNPQLQMITAGEWEISIYPHLPAKYRPMDVIANVFFIFDGEILHGEIIDLDSGPFMFIHRKTTQIKEELEEVVYCDFPSEKYNYKTALTKHTDPLSRKVQQFIREGKVFYADNEVGEILRNYCVWSTQYSITN